MSAVRLPQLGSVVWAELEDANGFRKVRPVVVVTATADIVAGGTVRVLAITTRLPSPLPDDHVLLPWERQGKARSGLRRRCAAVATWQAEIPISAVQQIVGILPPAEIEDLLAKVAPTLSPQIKLVPRPTNPRLVRHPPLNRSPTPNVSVLFPHPEKCLRESNHGLRCGSMSMPGPLHRRGDGAGQGRIYELRPRP